MYRALLHTTGLLSVQFSSRDYKGKNHAKKDALVISTWASEDPSKVVFPASYREQVDKAKGASSSRAKKGKSHRHRSRSRERSSRHKKRRRDSDDDRDERSPDGRGSERHRSHRRVEHSVNGVSRYEDERPPPPPLPGRSAHPVSPPPGGFNAQPHPQPYQSFDRCQPPACNGNGASFHHTHAHRQESYRPQHAAYGHSRKAHAGHNDRHRGSHYPLHTSVDRQSKHASSYQESRRSGDQHERRQSHKDPDRESRHCSQAPKTKHAKEKDNLDLFISAGFGQGFAAAPKVLGDLFEAIVGAVYIDCGGDLEILWGVSTNFATL